jgi:hypothetical protein
MTATTERLNGVTMTIFRPDKPEPMPEGGILRRTFKVGRFNVTMTYDLVALKDARGCLSRFVTQWEPDKPKRLTTAEFRQYFDQRDAVYQQVANMTNGNTMVIDPGRK